MDGPVLVWEFLTLVLQPCVRIPKLRLGHETSERLRTARVEMRKVECLLAARQHRFVEPASMVKSRGVMVKLGIHRSGTKHSNYASPEHAHHSLMIGITLPGLLLGYDSI